MSPDRMQQAASPVAEATLTDDGFAQLLQREFKPRTEQYRDAIERAVGTLAGQALAETQLIGDDAVATIQAIVAELDRKLTEQLNQIIHHPEFQQLEAAWRGLHQLV